jgi:hypothetical protein
MDRDAVITALSHEGKSQRAIARQIGLSQPAIRKRLLKLGLLNPPILSPAVPPPSGDTPPAPPLSVVDNRPAPPLSVVDNRPAVPLELPEPSRENSAGQLSRCFQCHSRFRQRLTERHCCVGCWLQSRGETYLSTAHSSDCRRVSPAANLPLRT